MGVLRLQGVRFILVGLASNLLLYLLYLVLTMRGIEPKIAMTFLYALGVAQTFFFNRRWTFSHNGVFRESLRRYLIVYGTGAFQQNLNSRTLQQWHQFVLRHILF